MVNIKITLTTLISFTISMFIISTAHAISDNQTMVNGTTLTGIEEQRPFAKFSVKTQISDECLSSPSMCNNIKEKDIYESVYVFYPNSYDPIVTFPGSNLPRNLVFDQEDYFEYPNTFSAEVDILEDVNLNNVTLDFESCSVYLSPGDEKNCIITIKPK
jgi:hypothetical protein